MKNLWNALAGLIISLVIMPYSGYALPNDCIWYIDYDGDGYVNGYVIIEAPCDAGPYGWLPVMGGGLDFCDNDPNYTDGCDNPSCESSIIPWFADNDGDGWGDANNFIMSCTILEGYVPWPNYLDCDDNDSSVGLGDLYYQDLDGDGYGYYWAPYTHPWIHPYNLANGNNYFDSFRSCEPISGYVTDHTDCNDGTASAHPGAQEICDGIDNDCNELTDDNDPFVAGRVIWYYDGDNDGFGNPNVILTLCYQPEGYVGAGTDCDDAHANTNPDATEITDGLDNDCDGLVDEGGTQMNIEAGNCEVVYYGYAPEACQTVTVTVTGGATPYSYVWNNGANTPSINVCPTVTTTYTIVVTDHNGATAADNVTVQVIDVRCGNNNNRVLLCHNMQTICVSPSAVPAHIVHGDLLGTCGTQNPCMGGGNNLQYFPQEVTSFIGGSDLTVADNNPEKDFDQFVSVFPNPADDQVIVNLPGDNIDYEVTFFSMEGQPLKYKNVESGKRIFNTELLTEGMCIIQIRSADSIITKRVVIMH